MVTNTKRHKEGKEEEHIPEICRGLLKVKEQVKLDK